MSFSFDCDRCLEPLVNPGALLFGPPREHKGGIHCTKYHLCGDCYRDAVGFMRATGTDPTSEDQ